MDIGEIIVLSIGLLYLVIKTFQICKMKWADCYGPNFVCWWRGVTQEHRICHWIERFEGIRKEEIAPLQDEKIYWKGHPCRKWCWLRWWNIFYIGLATIMSFIGVYVQDWEFYFYFVFPELIALVWNILDVSFYEYILTDKRIIIYKHLWRRTYQYDLVSYIKRYRGILAWWKVWQPSGCYDLNMICSSGWGTYRLWRFFYSISLEDIQKIKVAISQIRALHGVPRNHPLDPKEILDPPFYGDEDAPSERSPSWLRGVVRL